MTIAAAFYCTDGVVVCADTSEETAFTKRDQTKITQIKHGAETYVFTGAGDADLLEVAIEEIIEARQRRKKKSAADWKEELRKDAARIFQNYVQPCVGLPEERVPSFDLIASIQVDGWVSVFRIRETLVRKIKPLEHVAVGMGKLMATSLIDQYLRSANLTMEATARIGSYILERVKRHVPGCGGFTEFCKQGVDGTLVPGSATRWQLAMAALDSINRSLIYAAVQDDDWLFDKAIKELLENTGNTRKAFQQAHSHRIEQMLISVPPKPSTARTAKRKQ